MRGRRGWVIVSEHRKTGRFIYGVYSQKENAEEMAQKFREKWEDDGHDISVEEVQSYNIIR